jgi:hypothetical protein
MSRWLAIIALILTSNVFTISEASAWSISHADAERLCVGKTSEQGLMLTGARPSKRFNVLYEFST